MSFFSEQTFTICDPNSNAYTQWNTMIITSVDGVFEDIFDISGDVIHDNFIDDDGFDNFLDSRLDVDSVLIDDIKLEHDSNSDQNSDHSHQSNEFFQNHDGKGI